MILLLFNCEEKSTQVSQGAYVSAEPAGGNTAPDGFVYLLLEGSSTNVVKEQLVVVQQ